jgi:hypothetical protein
VSEQEKRRIIYIPTLHTGQLVSLWVEREKSVDTFFSPPVTRGSPSLGLANKPNKGGRWRGNGTLGGMNEVRVVEKGGEGRRREEGGWRREDRSDARIINYTRDT